jgi:tetratricopeptide (TPR) repeat protein
VRSIIGKTALIAVLTICVSAGAAPIAPTTSPAARIQAESSQSIDVQITAQVARLGDDDPTVRRNAADALVHFGAVARPAVLAASRGDDPQIADAAQQVLRSLPWSIPDDPPDVKRQLDTYGDASVADRIGIIAQLSGVPQSQPALLRLLSDEPNEDICWQIVSQLVAQSDLQTFAAARQFDLHTARPAALVLAARAWLTPLTGGGSGTMVDRDKALALLRRAVDLESVAPTYDDGQLDFAFDELASDAVDHQQYDAAATLRRQQCKRIGITRSRFPSPFFELLVLHANFGPLAGFQDDLETYPNYVAMPESLFVLSRFYARQGQMLMSQTMEQAALAAAHSSEERSIAIEFLMNHEWNDLAAKECRVTLARGDGRQDEEDVRAHWLLSTIDAMRGDETDAANQLRTALDGPRNFTLDPHFEQLLRIGLAQHALHVAQARGDAAEEAHQVDELMRLHAEGEDVAIDLVPELKSLGRGEEAAKIFQGAFQSLKAQIDAGNADPTLMNDTAWLCARCGEHLEEALDWSNRAVAAQPDNAAFLDTNAEAHFRKGQATEAVRLETRALTHQPGDPFMEGQIKRFRTGEASATKPNAP